MSIQSQFDREEDRLCEAVNSGEISMEEYRRELRELRAEYRACAEEAAQEAYDHEMEQW